jgi:hypothetical protein
MLIELHTNRRPIAVRAQDVALVEQGSAGAVLLLDGMRICVDELFSEVVARVNLALLSGGVADEDAGM